MTRLVGMRLHAIASNWYAKLSFLFACILLWQWFDSLEDYWWPETFAIVHGVLIAGVLIEWLAPSRLWMRLGLHTVSLLVFNMAYSGFRWVAVPDTIRDWEPWREWLAATAAPLDPFIWISLPVLALFLFAGYFCRTRIQVMIITGASLVSLTILYSCTRIYFWDEVAWCVLVGLSWLIAEHFNRFQRNHPETWKHMLEYPLTFLLSVVLVLSLVMVSGIFVPNVQPMLKDPYTLWVESRGETVPSFVGDKLERTSAAGGGDATSGYSREDGELGGGFQFDYSEVMTVSTTRRSYWRGETKSVYTGAGWVDSEAETREAAISGLEAEQTLPSYLDDSEAETEEIIQTVNIVRQDSYPVLFGAAPIRSITSLGDEERPFPSALAWLPESGELRWPQSERTPYPDTYTVVSHVPVLDEEKLRASATVQDRELADAYTQLPSSLPGRVVDLAKELTAGATNDYDKVKLIETYLRNNFPYTNTPDLSKRSSDDFVDAFLFEIREGYCDYFSTAMAVLTRASGIPARWVKGYAPGILPADIYMGGIPEEAIDPNMGGVYTVRNADAHSWVEVYFEGYGWFPFEPTAGFSYPYSMPTDTPVLPDLDMTDVGADAGVAESGDGFSVSPVWTIGGGVILLAAAAFYARRTLVGAWRRLRFGSLTGNQMIVMETEKLTRYCRKRGLERHEHETLRETFARWSEVRRSLAGELQEVLAVFERAKYSPWQATHADAEQLAVKIRLIREKL